MLKSALVLVTAVVAACTPEGWTPNWYDKEVVGWARSTAGCDPDGYQCRTWNQRFAECDASVKGQVYPLDCYYNGGCRIKYRK